jgi:hypothetical protein
MRDFEDVDGDCNESQPRWDDDTDAWNLDDITIEALGSDFVEPENFPF